MFARHFDIHFKLLKPGLGCCIIITVKLTLKADAQPKYCKPRKLPFALKPIVDAELDCLQNDCVLEKKSSQLGNPLLFPAEK